MLKHIYNFFSSVKLTIFLLLALAVTSISGTVIEQQANPDVYLREYGETVYRIFKFLDFTNVYHSWWYVSLLLLLAVNLIVCSVRMFPRKWNLAKNPRKKLLRGSEKNLKIANKLTLTGSISNISKKLVDALRNIGYKVESQSEEGTTYVFGDKNLYARFGVYVVHLGVLIMIIGGFVTALFGYRGYMNLAVGESSNLVSVFGKNQIVELPFKVKCNNFKMDYYPSGMPKAYISNLSIIKNGKTVKKKIIVVNKPLSYKSVSIYQASYSDGVMIVALRQDGKAPREIGLAMGQFIKIKDNMYTSIVSLSKTGQIGIEFLNNGKKLFALVKPLKWYFIPKTDVSFSIIGFKDVPYTGLQVAKDPGTWVVWTGSTILVIGLIIVFFISHHRIWCRLERGKEGKVSLIIGGIASKGSLGLTSDINKVLKVLKHSYCNDNLKEVKDD